MGQMILIDSAGDTCQQTNRMEWSAESTNEMGADADTIASPHCACHACVHACHVMRITSPAMHFLASLLGGNGCS